MNGIKGDQKGIEENTGLHTRLCRGILAVYFFIMAVVYPLYAPGGYARIGEVKYFFFRNVTLVMLAAAGGVIVPAALVRRDREWIVKQYRRMSVTDWLVYGYCLTVMLSYLCSDYKEDALWGVQGWYMGVMSQLMFALLYFFFSRYFCSGYGKKAAGGGTIATGGRQRTGPWGFSVWKWLGVWLAASTVVFVLGICNRYSLYPIGMEGQTETFLSTLGNINWYCGYWSVTAPVGIMLYWCSEKGAARLLSGVFSFIAMLTGVTQGSSSVWLVFLVLLSVLFVLSLQSNRRLYRFLELCMMFAGACQAGRLLQEVPGLTYNYRSYQPGEGSMITDMLIGYDVTPGALFVLVCCYAAVRGLEKRRGFRVEKHKWLWGMSAAAVALVGCITALLLLVDSGVIWFREVHGTMERDGYLEPVLDEDWGNGRGASWMCGLDAVQSMDGLHKLVGIGPDCFADYIYEVPELAEKMVDRFGDLRLTNAHNEWITVLVNTGMLGLFCYAGTFLTAFIRFAGRASKEPLLYVCAVAVLTYTAHNMVSFQQVLHTPYLFIVLGIGEGLLRALRDGGEPDGRSYGTEEADG